jgi:predicted MFS family arabinose efflux permease
VGRPGAAARHAGTTLAFAGAGAGALPLAVVARAAERGSPATGAALLGALAAGALVGSLLAARPGDPARRVPVALAVVAIGFALATAAPTLGWTAAALAVAGVADGVLLPAVLAVRAAHTRPGEREAVFTTAASLKIAVGAAGAGLGGLLLAATGPDAALAAAAALHAAGALVALPPRGPAVGAAVPAQALAAMFRRT